MNTPKRQRGFMDIGWKDDGRGDEKPSRVRVALWRRFVPAFTLLLFVLMMSLLGLLLYANYRGAENDVLALIGILGLASTACLLFSFLVQTSARPQD